MKKLFIYTLFIAGITMTLSAQEKEKKFKVPKMNLGEKIGKLAGNLMTGKADNLAAVSIKNNFICGIYSPEIETSEIKFFKDGLIEGDYLVSVTFMKQEGMGMIELEGEVTCEGEPMEYVGLGSYVRRFDLPPANSVEVNIKAINGDEATFNYPTIQSIHFVTVNGETSLPVLDMDEDIELEYYNPPGSEGTKVRLSLITDVMGARALNHFADFNVDKIGRVKVTIPKEALANPEIAGQLNAGNFNKGENFLVLEREKLINKGDYGSEQKPGNAGTSDITVRSYASMPVIVKGKQDGGLLVSLKVTGQSEDKSIGYDFYKPNATTGIPLSKASKFGLVSFTMSASTYKRESETSTSSSTIGNTRYTTTTTTTTTYQFPQLPDSYWDRVMDKVYAQVSGFLASEYNIEFVAPEVVMSTPQYGTLFSDSEANTMKGVQRSYKGTKRVSPQSMGEIFGSLSSNQTSDNPTVNMMKEAGDLDGLMSMHLDLVVGANADGNIVLFPTLKVSAYGRNEKDNDKQGRYFDGAVVRTTGESFNEDLLKSNPAELARVVSAPLLIEVFKIGIKTLRSKEVELGFDKIWSIGE
jgi:hypothetical protein